MKKLYKINQFTGAEWDAIEYDWNEHEDEIVIIEKKDAYCMDITANGKRIVPILRKIEEAMTAAGLAGETGIYAGWFGEWANELTDRRDRKYFIWNYSGRSDRERGCWSYSWGIEQIDEERWYIFLNIAKPQEAPQEAPAAEAEQQPTETENAPQAAKQAAEGTTTDEQKEEANTMSSTERYDYIEHMAEDIKDAIRERYTDDEIRAHLDDDRDEFAQELNDDLWTDDSVTGNASGSYYCNAWRAEEAISHNWDLIADMIDEFDAADILRRGPEAIDV